MKHSPVTAHVVIVYEKENETSTAFLKDVLGRQRELFTCPHRHVVAKIAAWSKLHDYDQCEIHCEQILTAAAEATVRQADDPQEN
jgi:hypothetical protein